MQRWKGFLYITYFLRVFLIACVIIAILQNYFLSDGTFVIFGLKLTQFYDHVDFRILPFLWVAFYFFSTVKAIFKIKGEFYFSELLISFIIALDAFTHINGYYSLSFYFISGYIWFDKIMHFLEGLILMIAVWPVIFQFAKEKMPSIKPSLWAYWMTAGYVSIFFICWEIFELCIDKSFGTNLITSRFDTNEDLAAGYIGMALGVLMIGLFRLINKFFPVNRAKLSN